MRNFNLTKQIFLEDLDEQTFFDQYPEVFSILLQDRTTGHHILWATDDYKHLSEAHQAHAQITIPSITGKYSGVIAPRIDKTTAVQTVRKKQKAEVFTPSWICNTQNNLVDEVWFGRADVFNHASGQSWTATTNKIQFPSNSAQSWKSYVDERRLEIACGEAPYLVSRYDTTTGRVITLPDRVGLLDRKLRIVTENTDNEQDWLKWSQRAYEATYGFEYQGDNLLLARENLLASYADYMSAALKRVPTAGELKRIATILSWNLWQMDGLTGFPPYSDVERYEEQQTLFDLFETRTSPVARPCQIKDWRSKTIHTFNRLL